MSLNPPCPLKEHPMSHVDFKNGLCHVTYSYSHVDRLYVACRLKEMHIHVELRGRGPYYYECTFGRLLSYNLNISW